jgi:curli biogenesis system outer membrane secretion channel CsgG
MTSLQIRLLAGIVLLTSGCGTGGVVGSSVDSVNAAPELASGPRPTIAVSSFKIAAPKAKEEVGDGLQDMLSMALLRTQCCDVLEPDQDGGGGADYLVTGALTEFEPSAGGVTASDQGNGGVAGLMQRIGVQNVSADAAQVGIDIRLVEQGTRKIRNATFVRGIAVDLESLEFSDDSLGSGLEVYSNTPMEAAVRDAIDKAAYFIAESTAPPTG